MPLLADKFVETLSDGKVIDRAVAIAMTKAMKYTSAQKEDLKVTVFDRWNKFYMPFLAQRRMKTS